MSVENDSILFWESVCKKSWKNIPNTVGARTQPCLIPLQSRKVLEMEPSNWTVAFMFSWNATRTESSVSAQPNSLSMLYKPDRLALSKALVRSMKTTHSGRDCSTLFSWSCLSENTMSAVFLEGRKPHWLPRRVLSAVWQTLDKRRRTKTIRAIHKSEMTRYLLQSLRSPLFL